MLALTVDELGAVTGAAFGLVVLIGVIMLRDTMSIRERVARLEEAIKALRRNGR